MALQQIGWFILISEPVVNQEETMQWQSTSLCAVALECTGQRQHLFIVVAKGRSRPDGTFQKNNNIL